MKPFDLIQKAFSVYKSGKITGKLDGILMRAKLIVHRAQHPRQRHFHPIQFIITSDGNDVDAEIVSHHFLAMKEN